MSCYDQEAVTYKFACMRRSPDNRHLSRRLHVGPYHRINNTMFAITYIFMVLVINSCLGYYFGPLLLRWIEADASSSAAGEQIAGQNQAPSRTAAVEAPRSHALASRDVALIDATELRRDAAMSDNLPATGKTPADLTVRAFSPRWAKI